MTDLQENIVLTEATYYILLSLWTPQHGYGIMQQTAERSGGRVRLAAGTLYGALSTLCDKGWIVQLPSKDRRKEYKLTNLGRAVLKQEHERLRQLVAQGSAVMEGDV